MRPSETAADSAIRVYEEMSGDESHTPKSSTNRSGLSICILASGSKGNAIYVNDGHTAILIDAGLTGVQMEGRLQSRGFSPRDLTAILVSHEHGDHVKGVGVLSRRYGLPVYVNPGTLAKAAGQIGSLHSTCLFECGREFTIGTLKIHPFSISHDAEDPSGFTVAGNGCKIGIATDLGVATALVREHLRECRLLVLEANHDPDMLQNGPYPWHLKQRIKSRTGHLSNEDAMALVAELQHETLEHIILAHLSAENNSPEKAHRKVGEAIRRSGIHLSVAGQDHCSRIFRLE